MAQDFPPASSHFRKAELLATFLVQVLESPNIRPSYVLPLLSFAVQAQLKANAGDAASIDPDTARTAKMIVPGRAMILLRN